MNILFMNDSMNCQIHLMFYNVHSIKLISQSWITLEVKIQHLCLSAIYKQNVSITTRLSDSVQCGRGLNFVA